MFRYVCACLVWLLSASSFAVVPDGPGFGYSGMTGGPFTSIVAACNGFKAERGLQYVKIYVDSATSGRCYNSNAALTDASSPNTSVSNTYARVCPINSTYQGASCVCSAGYIDDPTHKFCQPVCRPGEVLQGNVCVPPVCQSGASRNESYSVGWGRHYTGSGGQIQIEGGGSVTPVGPSTLPPANNCFAGCTYSSGTSFDSVNMDQTQNGLYRIDRQVTYNGTGANCSLPPTVPELPPAPPCSGALGTVNGLQTCLPAIDTPEKEVKKTTSEKILPTGAKEVTTTTTTTDCKLKECKTSTSISITTTPGSVSSHPPGTPLPPGATLNPDGTIWTPNGPSTTTSGTGGAGSGSGTGSGPGTGQPGVTTEPLNDFCTRNPKSKVCGQEGDGDSSFGGTCSSGHECHGDAVQCAIARGAWKQACATERGDMPEEIKVVNKDVPISGIAKNTGWGPENSSCPAPKWINLSFATISMPFDLLCDFANGIRPFVIGLAWITAAFSFFGFARRGE